jgi:UDP-N-acetyl-D-mannosaminuronic acid dehydrogenase
MKICVYGIGCIGLPTAALFANGGHNVIGYDVDISVVEQLRCGGPQTTDPALQAFVERALASNLDLSTEAVAADCHVICVPTPYDADARQADLRYVERAGETISTLLRPGDTVILKSTVPPGTTETVLAPVLEQEGLSVRAEIGLAYCPETLLPGNAVRELQHNDRIISGVNTASMKRMYDLYEPLTEGEIRPAPNTTTAEFVKLVQNASRDVEIAFANELAKIARDYGVNARKAIELANNHSRVGILEPGPGVGGHCLPIDPLFLAQGSDHTDLIEHARQVNDGMAEYITELLRLELGSLDRKTVAILGVAYKGNVSDTRNSPGLEVAETIVEGAVDGIEVVADGGSGSVDVRLYDPHVEDQTLDLRSRREALIGADAAVITADHSEFADLTPDHVADWMAGDLVIDTKAVLNEDAWVDSDYRVVGL